MYWRFYISALIIIGFSFCSSIRDNVVMGTPYTDSIVKVEMNLSAFGVESDDFPSIKAYVNFQTDSSNCEKSFYNPAYKNSTYYLSKAEIQQILKILMNSDVEKLKREFKVQSTDQPTSTITIYTSTKKIIIKDYGLKGDSPLQELYKVVYKF